MLVRQPDLKEELKRIKELTSSVLLANPSLQDNNSELISKIGVLYNATGDNKRAEGK